MTDVQEDFINTIKRSYPFLSTEDTLSDALSYALELSEMDEDRNFFTVIDGKVFLAEDKTSFWDGKPLTED